MQIFYFIVAGSRSYKSGSSGRKYAPKDALGREYDCFVMCWMACINIFNDECISGNIY